MGKTIIDLANSEAAITDPSQYYIETQKIGDSSTKRTLLTKLITYLQAVFAPKFVATNTASGATTVTINAKSGVATFTQDVVANSTANYTITNSQVTVSSKILFSVDADFGGTAGLLNLMGYNCAAGAVDLYFHNPELSNDFDVDINVSFQILN